MSSKPSDPRKKACDNNKDSEKDKNADEPKGSINQNPVNPSNEVLQSTTSDEAHSVAVPMEMETNQKELETTFPEAVFNAQNDKVEEKELVVTIEAGPLKLQAMEV